MRGRTLVVKRFPRPKDLQSVSDRRELQQILETVRGTPVLTIGDSEGFAQLGGVIGMVLDNRKVSIEINLKAAGRQRLKISSHLLRLARLTG